MTLADFFATWIRIRMTKMKRIQTDPNGSGSAPLHHSLPFYAGPLAACVPQTGRSRDAASCSPGSSPQPSLAGSPTINQ